MNEEQHQVALFHWATAMQNVIPELRLLHAIPLGGYRHKATGRRLKASGAKAGVPDIALPVARDKYHGLYIELKVGKNKPTQHQQWWLDRLNEQGYKAIVCYGWQEAMNEITNYLGITQP